MNDYQLFTVVFFSMQLVFESWSNTLEYAILATFFQIAYYFTDRDNFIFLRHAV